jgi:hypothetical protein
MVVMVFCTLFNTANAYDKYVKKAMSLMARDFEKDLPDQPIDVWLRSNIPARYMVVWGERITDCGESTGTAVDKERDMPMCIEVEIKEGPEIKGYLALFVGTKKRGLFKDGYGIYFGYLEHSGNKYIFKRLSDVLKVK